MGQSRHCLGGTRRATQHHRQENHPHELDHDLRAARVRRASHHRHAGAQGRRHARCLGSQSSYQYRHPTGMRCQAIHGIPERQTIGAAHDHHPPGHPPRQLRQRHRPHRRHPLFQRRFTTTAASPSSGPQTSTPSSLKRNDHSRLKAVPLCDARSRVQPRMLVGI